MNKKKIMGYTGLGYLALVMPRIFHRPQKSRETYYAHRKFTQQYEMRRKNSLAAFEKAVKAGYGIELDVQLTRDNQVVVTTFICGETAMCRKSGRMHLRRTTAVPYLFQKRGFLFEARGAEGGRRKKYL